MKAKIDNDELEVKIVDDNYSDEQVEVELQEKFVGAYAIIDKDDIIN